MLKDGAIQKLPTFAKVFRYMHLQEGSITRAGFMFSRMVMCWSPRRMRRNVRKTEKESRDSSSGSFRQKLAEQCRAQIVSRFFATLMATALRRRGTHFSRDCIRHSEWHWWETTSTSRTPTLLFDSRTLLERQPSRRQDRDL